MHVVQHPHVHLRKEGTHVDCQEELDGEVLEVFNRFDYVKRLDVQQAIVFSRTANSVAVRRANILHEDSKVPA
jgi:hypothetical protein